MQYVYKITNPIGMIYIGCASNLKRRFSRYKCLDCKSQPKLYESMLKYKFENHKFEIVEQCENEHKKIREAYWGMFFDVLGENGLNGALPKANFDYPALSNETINKLKKIAIGRIPPSRKGYIHKESFLNHQKSLTGSARYNSIELLNIETGIYYESISLAAKAHNISHGRITENVFKTKINKTPFIAI